MRLPRLSIYIRADYHLLLCPVHPYVYLTESGKKYADRLNLEFARIESQALEGFTPAEKQQLQDLLSRVYDNMVTTYKKEGTNK